VTWLLWIAAKLFGLWGWLRKGLRWITGSRERLLLVGIGALLLAGWGQHHTIAARDREIAARDREIAALRLERDRWMQASKVLRKSTERLTAAVHEQNAAAERLKAAAEQRVLAGQAALAEAKQRSAVREGLAARIDAQRAPAGAAIDCRTSSAVMAAKEKM
jgi:hypothetical protein